MTSEVLSKKLEKVPDGLVWLGTDSGLNVTEVGYCDDSVELLCSRKNPMKVDDVKRIISTHSGIVTLRTIKGKILEDGLLAYGEKAGEYVFI